MKRCLILFCFCLLILSVRVAAEQSFWGDLADAWLLVKVSAACDYTNPTTREFAMNAAKPSPSGALTITQVCNIFDAVILPHWTYFHDPYRTRMSESVTAASDSIRIGLRGDCDDFAVLMASCIRAIGGACRIALVNGEQGGHAFAEVYVGDERSARNVREYIVRRYGAGYVYFDPGAPGTYWLTLDWSGTAPRWADAYPGRPPLVRLATATKVLYVPILSYAAAIAGYPWPVPSVP